MLRDYLGIFPKWQKPTHQQIMLILAYIIQLCISMKHIWDQSVRRRLDEMNKQTCSNVLAHGWRPHIGGAGAAEAPVSIPGGFDRFFGPRVPRLARGVLYPDLV